MTHPKNGRTGRYDYIAQNNPEAALRFFDATRQTFSDLAHMPGIGSIYLSSNRRLKDIRKWHVKGFRSFLIFYRTQENTIEILRILNAAQDIKGIIKNI